MDIPMNPPLANESFNGINLGMLMIKKEPREIIFSNHHFKKVARDREKIIIDTIFNDLDRIEGKSSFRCDMEIENDFVIGYTIYKLGTDEFVVFLNDISHKRIYFENRGENRFYDRLSSLIAEVAHELGNPLAAMTTTLQVLHEYMGDWEIEKQKEYVQRAIDDIDRLSKYLDRMRSFSRIDSFDRKPVRLDSIIQRVLDRVQPGLTRKQISVTYNNTDDLEVLVDDKLFFLVLHNLFLNSEENLPRYGKISLTVEEVNEFYVKLAYQNDGPPIPDHLLDKIFLPFFSTTKKNPGIGLAASLKLMTRMGGTMKIDSPDEGYGIKFILHLAIGSSNRAA